MADELVERAREILAAALAHTRADGGKLRCDTTKALNAITEALAAMSEPTPEQIEAGLGALDSEIGVRDPDEDRALCVAIYTAMLGRG